MYSSAWGDQCQHHKKYNCKAAHCLKAERRTVKRATSRLRGRKKALRKQMQQVLVPGACGVLSSGKFFTVIGWGQVNDVWHVLVSLDGQVDTWNTSKIDELFEAKEITIIPS